MLLVIGGDVEPANAMKSLHLLPVPERIKFKIASLVRKALLTGTPCFLANTLPALTCKESEIVVLELPHGIAYPHNSGPLIRSVSSRLISRPIFSHSSKGRSAHDAQAYGALQINIVIFIFYR